MYSRCLHTMTINLEYLYYSEGNLTETKKTCKRESSKKRVAKFHHLYSAIDQSKVTLSQKKAAACPGNSKPF